jgi:hypothetical protein
VITYAQCPNAPLVIAAAAALSDEWQSHDQVWRRLGCWARGSVREGLLALHAQGRCERRAVPCPWGFKYEYRRLQVAQARAA